MFENNVFFGKHQGRPHDPGARLDKPPLLNPGGGASGLHSLGGYKLRPGASLARAVSFRVTVVAISSTTLSLHASHRCRACLKKGDETTGTGARRPLRLIFGRENKVDRTAWLQPD